jgi:NAD(P)-dependent dehydrogenase (short-subunit alcohol dehydrogenase family)
MCGTLRVLPHVTRARDRKVAVLKSKEIHMRIFVTGATGFIGSAIVQELIGAGHRVLGLSHNDASAKALAKLKVEAHQGDLKDTDSLAAGAKACDGVIHTAYLQDFSDMASNSETEEALGLMMIGLAKNGAGTWDIAMNVDIDSNRL